MSAAVPVNLMPSSEMIDKFIHADASVRALVLSIWISILVESYRDLAKELETIANYSPEFIAAKVVSCQQRLQAYPEYKYVIQHGDKNQIKYIQDLLEALRTPPQPRRHVEPVTLIRPSVEELRRRIWASLS